MIIHRSILKELFINFTVAILSLSVLLFMEKFVRLTRVIMGRGVEIRDVFKLFLYLQPSISLISVPMAILIAIFLTYGRMANDNEITIMKGSGMGFFSISRAALILSITGFSVLLFISLHLSPISMHLFRQTMYEVITKKASLAFEEETFSKVFKNTVIYVKKMPTKTTFKGIFVFRETDSPVRERVVIVAEDGSIASNPEEGMVKLSMHNGLIHTFSREKSSKITFSKYDFVLTSGAETTKDTRPGEIGTMELWEGRKRDVLWAIELNRRFAIPFACLIFGFLGPALSSRMGKVGRLGGFALSLSFLIFYYILLIIGEVLVKAHKVPAFWGSWMPNMTFGAIASLFFYIAYRDRPAKR